MNAYDKRVRMLRRRALRRYCPDCGRKTGTAEDPGSCEVHGRAGLSKAEVRASKAKAPAAPARPQPTAGRIRPDSKPSWLKHAEIDYDAYLKSSGWRAIRRAVLARDGGQCTECRSAERLHVHHMHYRTLGFETGEELLTLCERCHDALHARWKSRRFSNPEPGGIRSAPFPDQAGQSTNGAPGPSPRERDKPGTSAAPSESEDPILGNTTRGSFRVQVARDTRGVAVRAGRDEA